MNSEISVQNKKYDSRESCFLFCYVPQPSEIFSQVYNDFVLAWLKAIGLFLICAQLGDSEAQILILDDQIIAFGIIANHPEDPSFFSPIQSNDLQDVVIVLAAAAFEAFNVNNSGGDWRRVRESRTRSLLAVGLFSREVHDMAIILRSEMERLGRGHPAYQFIATVAGAPYQS
jgi:hypothetical protein